jgi:acyl-CoA thioesterase YciA
LNIRHLNTDLFNKANVVKFYRVTNLNLPTAIPSKMRRIPRIVDQLVLQTIAMPCHTNANGDIFGGWIMSQMDLGAAVIAQKVSRGRVATVAIDKVNFTNPIAVGDIVSCRGTLTHVGNTSMGIKMICMAQRGSESKQVTEGTFTFVAITETGRPRRIPTDQDAVTACTKNEMEMH